MKKKVYFYISVNRVVKKNQNIFYNVKKIVKKKDLFGCFRIRGERGDDNEIGVSVS